MSIEVNTQAAPKRTDWGASAVIGAVVGIAALVVYFSLPDRQANARSECLRFAQEHVTKHTKDLADALKLLETSTGMSKVKAIGSWTKNGRYVVQLAFYDKDEDKVWTPRICVVDYKENTVQIVAIWDHGRWMN